MENLKRIHCSIQKPAYKWLKEYSNTQKIPVGRIITDALTIYIKEVDPSWDGAKDYTFQPKYKVSKGTK